jgi:hypothetical protein
VTRSTNRSTPEAPAPRHPATVRNVTLGTASTPASQAVMEPSVYRPPAMTLWPGQNLRTTAVWARIWLAVLSVASPRHLTLVATGNRRSCILEGT